MIGWCIVIVLAIFSIGFIASAWVSSKKIIELDDEIHRLNMKLIEIYNENEVLKKSIKITSNKSTWEYYPVYDVKG